MSRARRAQIGRAVWSVLLVVAAVDAEDAVEVGAAEDEDPCGVRLFGPARKLPPAGPSLDTPRRACPRPARRSVLSLYIGGDSEAIEDRDNGELVVGGFDSVLLGAERALIS